MSKADAEKLGLVWGDVHFIPLSGADGIKVQARTAEPSQAFWDAWRKNPQALRELGIIPRKLNGKYRAVQYIHQGK